MTSLLVVVIDATLLTMTSTHAGETDLNSSTQGGN